MSSAVDGNDLSGLLLDARYLLEKRLGEGAMGQVYIAHHQALDRQVAVKVLHSWLASEEKHRKRFLREARAATRIKHPNVVEMLDFGTTPSDSVYLVMELLHGRDLRAVLEQEGPLPWMRARHFLLQAVAALREAHRQEVIHRDIKPANCFVCDPPQEGVLERMKLLDFGIAKLEDPGASGTGRQGRRLTQTGELVGTLAYMAPEFADGKPASVYTDMYALGIMGYQLVTGDVPFTGRNEFQVLARHLNEPPVRPRVLVPELPEAAEAALLTMLAKKPELRFESMADVEQALLAIPGDGADPVVFPRSRDSSGGTPGVRPRESSAPPRGRIRHRTPAQVIDKPPAGRARQLTPASGDAKPPRGRARQLTPAAVLDRRAADSDPTLSAPPIIDAPQVSKPPPARADESNEAGSSDWRMGDPIDFDGGPDIDYEELDKVPRREWGTWATVILLVLLSAAAVVSVLLRQQGIELHELWPWSEPEPEPEPDAEPPGETPANDSVG